MFLACEGRSQGTGPRDGVHPSTRRMVGVWESELENQGHGVFKVSNFITRSIKNRNVKT